MKDNIADISVRNVNEVQNINRELIEKALKMRCVSYLSQVKAKLLTETIYEIDSSKKNLQHTTDELLRKQHIILRQKQKLEEKNKELLGVHGRLEQMVRSRTSQLESTIVELQESEERYSTLFKYSHPVMLLVDPESGDIVDSNDAASSFYGWTKKELLSKKITDLNVHSKKKTYNNMKAAKKKMRGHFFFQHRLANGEIKDVEVHSSAVKLSGRDLLYSIIHDITRRKQTEKALWDSQRFLDSIFNSIQDGISVLTPELEILHTNNACQAMFPGKFPLKKETKCFEVYRDSQDSCHNCPAILAVKNRRLETQEVEIIREDQKKGVLEVYAFPMFDEDDEVTGVVECMRDISEKRQVEEALREVVLQQREAVNASGVGLWDWHLNTEDVHYSSQWKRQIGYEDHEIQNNFHEWEKRVHPEDLSDVTEKIEQFRTEMQDKFETEFRFKHKNGSYLWILAKASLLKDEKGIPVRMIGSHLDITERVLSEKKIEASLQEKKVLLREIHHRVKNNLAVIISLLNLQGNQSSNSEIISALSDSRDRVKSMSLIHETLYRSESFGEIKLIDYIASLGNRLLQVLQVHAGQVEIVYDIEDISLDLDQAIPFGLILNELLTNALKYAFPDEQGRITVTVRCIAKNEIQLVVHDNGIGLPEKKSLSEFESFGLSIVSNLVENQLEGSLDHSNNSGACFSIHWPGTNC